MRRTTSFILLLLLTQGVFSQDSLAIDYGNTITAKELSEHLHIIAADDYEGRETGYPGQKKCEEYLVNYYKSIGIPPAKGSYIQEFQLNLNDPSKVFVKKGANEYSFLEDFYYHPATSDRKIQGEVVFMGYGIKTEKYTDPAPADLKGKVVMIWDGEPRSKSGAYMISGNETPNPWSTDRAIKQEYIEGLGASAMMIVYPDYDFRREQIAGYFGHMSMSLLESAKEEKANMPVFHISMEMAESILGVKQFKKLLKAKKKAKKKTVVAGPLSIEFARNSERLTSSNVMGYIEGSDLKDEVIVISAHYDHIGVDGEVYNGADDDGSGTVATLEIADAFVQAKAAGHGPRRSILLLNVSGEEKGLLGSQYYSEHPVFPLENTVADLNIDMIGRVDEQHEENTNYVYLIGADRLSQDLHDIGEQINNEYVGLELDYTFNAEDDPNRFYYRSDHYNFAKNNIPSVFYFCGVHEDYHKPGDTVDKIMFPKLEKITKLVFYTAWELANRKERIQLNQ